MADAPPPPKRPRKEKTTDIRPDVVGMMYGYGDADRPDVESAALVEQLVANYVRELCDRARAVARLSGKPLDHACFLVAVRHDRGKYERALHLLDKKQELKELKKIDKVAPGDVD